ncbi:MAG: sigma-70 family RNA polymerase sigma factor [Bacteroidetes bacterium]|nr:MAG: sigma-70 family RNA polymerase sigma factor [Bacteroidota bacterium]
MNVDRSVLEACLTDDRKAHKDLYAYCYQAFIPLCYKYHSQDEDARFAFNHAFMKILSGLKDVNLDDLNFHAWAKRITRNSLIDDYRKNKLHRSHFTTRESDWELEIHSQGSQNEAESQFAYQNILQMIDEIPQNHALVFRLYVIEGYSHKEIAEQLDLTVGTSKWHLSIARKLLREKINKLNALTETRLVV